MKTSELKKKLGEYDVYVAEGLQSTELYYKGDFFIEISENKAMRINSLFQEKFSEFFSSYDIPYFKKVEVFDIAMEYAKTPINERKDIKLYYIKLFDDEFGYLNYDELDHEWNLYKKGDGEALGKAKFTKEEIEKVNPKFLDFAVPVEEDE